MRFPNRPCMVGRDQQSSISQWRDSGPCMVCTNQYFNCFLNVQKDLDIQGGSISNKIHTTDLFCGVRQTQD